MSSTTESVEQQKKLTLRISDTVYSRAAPTR